MVSNAHTYTYTRACILNSLFSPLSLSFTRNPKSRNSGPPSDFHYDIPNILNKRKKLKTPFKQKLHSLLLLNIYEFNTNLLLFLLFFCFLYINKYIKDGGGGGASSIHIHKQEQKGLYESHPPAKFSYSQQQQ